jgi:hypothetical protein
MHADNASSDIKARKLVHVKYGNIRWSPCAALCLNLILKDISSIHFQSLASRSCKVTVFVDNHQCLLAWLSKRFVWGEIVRPRPNRFATSFLTKKNIHVL